MENLNKQISDIGVVPGIKIDNAKDAGPLAAALKKGGLCCAEVTFRTDAAEDAIKLIAKEYPDFLIAAGTVLTPKQADAAMAAPYTKIKFMPTGGIGPKNLAEYLNCKAIFACGGSWMVPGDKITDGKFDEIEQLTREAVELLKEIRG